MYFYIDFQRFCIPLNCENLILLIWFYRRFCLLDSSPWKQELWFTDSVWWIKSFNSHSMEGSPDVFASSGKQNYNGRLLHWTFNCQLTVNSWASQNQSILHSKAAQIKFSLSFLTVNHTKCAFSTSGLQLHKKCLPDFLAFWFSRWSWAH